MAKSWPSHLLLLVELLFLHPSLGGARFFHSSVGWCCLPSPPPSSGAPLSPLLLCGASLPLPSLGGVLGGATFPLSSVGWCRLASFVRCCCVLPFPFAWCCLPSHPLGGAAFSPSAVWVLLCLLLLWAVLRFSSPSSWCCLPSPPSLSEAAFSPSSVWWCFLSSPSSLGGAAFSPSSAGRCCFTFSFFEWCFGWGYFSLLFCWVVPLGLPL